MDVVVSGVIGMLSEEGLSGSGSVVCGVVSSEASSVAVVVREGGGLSVDELPSSVSSSMSVTVEYDGPPTMVSITSVVGISVTGEIVNDEDGSVTGDSLLLTADSVPPFCEYSVGSSGFAVSYTTVPALSVTGISVTVLSELPVSSGGGGGGSVGATDSGSRGGSGGSEVLLSGEGSPVDVMMVSAGASEIGSSIEGVVLELVKGAWVVSSTVVEGVVKSGISLLFSGSNVV